MSCEFKPFDRVLVRDSDVACWKTSLFSHYVPDSEYKYITIHNGYKQCIPFKGNEDLLGTNKELEEKTGLDIILIEKNSKRKCRYLGSETINGTVYFTVHFIDNNYEDTINFDRFEMLKRKTEEKPFEWGEHLLYIIFSDNNITKECIFLRNSTDGRCYVSFNDGRVLEISLKKLRRPTNE